jgi:hypothetical protein
VAEPGEFAVHAAVSPGGVLPGQPQDQVADLLADGRAAGPARVRPLALAEAPVPGQQRSWRDQAMAAQSGGQQAGQRGQDGPVGPARGRVTWRRRTATSWRSTMISASFDA